jgi:hypothetical protein
VREVEGKRMGGREVEHKVVVLGMQPLQLESLLSFRYQRSRTK